MSLFGFLSKKEDLADVYSRNPVLLDVRTEGEFASGNVPGSINIPLDQLSSKINQVKKFDRPVVAFCMSGMRSGQAKSILSKNGIECYNGGGWSQVARKISE